MPGQTGREAVLCNIPGRRFTAKGAGFVKTGLNISDDAEHFSLRATCFSLRAKRTDVLANRTSEPRAEMRIVHTRMQKPFTHACKKTRKCAFVFFFKKESAPETPE